MFYLKPICPRTETGGYGWNIIFLDRKTQRSCWKWRSHTDFIVVEWWWVTLLELWIFVTRWTGGPPGEVYGGRFSGPLSPPCETPGSVSLLWPLHTSFAICLQLSYGEPNLNLFVVQVKNFGPISRTPCACMEHVIISIFLYSLLNVFVEKSVRDFSLLVPLVDRTILRSTLHNFCIVSYRWWCRDFSCMIHVIIPVVL